jgi:hypothetical protein
VILHELVHAFKPRHVDLQPIRGLFVRCFFAEALPNTSPKIIFEQGDIFETMYFDGIGHCSLTNFSKSKYTI